MNNVTLVGRLTRDSELSYIPNSGTPVARFTIAVDRDYKDKNGNIPVDFIPVEVMGKVAEFVANYITKGRLVAINGSMRVENYMHHDEKRTYTKVAAKSVKALDKAKKTNSDNDNATTFQPSYEPPTGLDPNGFEAINDDEIPF